MTKEHKTTPFGLPEEILVTLRQWRRFDLRTSTADVIDSLRDALWLVPVPAGYESTRTIALSTEEEARPDSAKAALRIAVEYIEVEGDLHTVVDIRTSWLLYASLRGSTVAALMFANAMVEEVREEFAVGNLSDEELRKLCTGTMEFFQDMLGRWLSPSRIGELAQAFELELEWREAPSGPSRVIIENWTLAPHSELTPYKALTRPIPLAGGDKDASSIVTTLNGEFPWLADAIDRIADDLALGNLNETPWVRIRPLLLVGPPGSGKSRFARRLAELIGTGFRIIDAGSSSDDRDLAGTAHGWSNREPGAILRLIANCGTANPVVVIDELDKAGGSERNGDIRRTLLAMLERETSRLWFDECLQAFCDLSAVSWVGTANSLEPISKMMLSRFAVVRVGLPGADSIDPILATMRNDIASEFDLDPSRLPDLDDVSHRALATALGKGRSLRSIRHALIRALAVTARKDLLSS